MRGKELLTPEQRLELMQVPMDIDERDLGIYYTLTSQDLMFIKSRRRDVNRLGTAIQICVLRHLGWSLPNIKVIPDKVIEYVARQLQVDSSVFSKYGQRENTLYEHLGEIREEYGYISFSPKEYRKGIKYLMNRALENSDTMYLIHETLSNLKQNKVILPAMTTIERMVWFAKMIAERRIYRILTQALTDEQKKQIDEMLEVATDKTISTLAWLRQDPGQPSPDSFKRVLDRLEYLRNLQLKVDVSSIHPRRLRQLARIGARYEARSFRRFKEEQRYGILVAYLINLIQDLTDQAIEINDKVINIFFRKGKKAQENMQKENGKALNQKLLRFVDLTTVLLEAKAKGDDLDHAIQSYISWDQLKQERDEAQDLARPINYDYIDLLKSRFRYLRQYTPILLEKLEFKSTEANESLIQALHVIKDMNETNKRKVPDDAPLDFVPKRFQNHIFDSKGNIDKTYYELAALTKLKDYIRSGDIHVTDSRKYKDLEEYFVPEQEWVEAKEKGTTGLYVPLTAKEYIADRKRALADRLYWLSKNINSLEGVSLEDGKIHVDRLEKETPEEAEQLSKKLYSLLPRVKLTDLLLEVDSWTHFTRHMTHASTGHEPTAKEKKALLAALMALGTNIGLTKMAEATPEFTYKQLVNASQWRMYDDALNRAQATLVNFQHRLALAFYWGDGTTSSSDGMRVQVGVSSMYADSNPHYGHGKGTTFYRFVSDQLSSYGVEVIPSNAREAIHTIDKILHHETDLQIKEHYTDTAGYTDQVFALSHIFGYRCAPRIRNVGEAQLFSIDPPKEFKRIQSLLRKIKTDVIIDNYDHALRVAHSIVKGKVAASLVLNKWGSYNRENNVSKTIRYMGQIEKTLFIIDYVTDETLRRRIQRGLNKGEAMNALARAVFFGKRGELRERSLVAQLQRASALNIIINAISVWNTIYLDEAAKYLENQGLLDRELLNHVSPLNWEHINFLGEYSFTSKPTSLDSLRSLNIN